jgi:hypothetical protein
MVQVVSMLSAFRCAICNTIERAMEKQAACAAARSSSGFVFFPSSKRSLNEYGVLDRTPLADEMIPVPDFRSPFHNAFAVRSMYFLLVFDAKK